ncbi:MAG: hypothetical protein K2N91_03380 [Muribaculaceae bacterium]|nr:hypothetical protein [Muribaculaceae bacterium]
MKRIISLSILSLPQLLFAQSDMTVAERAYIHADQIAPIFSQSYADPAVNQLRDSVSLSNIEIGYKSRRESEALSVQLGDGKDFFQASARTYIKHGLSTLWGRALYNNGSIRGTIWNESADADLIYPYLTADSVGGDMKYERYFFAGGYADRRGRWLWGAELSYDAGLYYRDIDPRPRNVTGRLDISAGVGYKVGRSVIAVDVKMRKYKQTNDIKFVSEMGKSKEYHLTGLGNHYARFAGEGESSYFDGYRYGIAADLYPIEGEGAVLSVDMSRFKFKKVLTALNKLPLCRAWHNAMSLSAGWKSDRWGVAARFEAYRRHGVESLFGDATSGIYPQIGEIEMYADNHYTAAIEGVYQIKAASATSVAIAPYAAYIHRSTIYADPASERLLNSVSASMSLSARSLINGCWMLDCRLAGAIDKPVESRLSIPEQTALTGIEIRDFAIAGRNSGSVEMRVAALRSLNDRFAIGVDGSYRRGFYTQGISTNQFEVSVKLIF